MSAKQYAYLGATPDEIIAHLAQDATRLGLANRALNTENIQLKAQIDELRHQAKGPVIKPVAGISCTVTTEPAELK